VIEPLETSLNGLKANKAIRNAQFMGDPIETNWPFLYTSTTFSHSVCITLFSDVN